MNDKRDDNAEAPTVTEPSAAEDASRDLAAYPGESSARHRGDPSSDMPIPVKDTSDELEFPYGPNFLHHGDFDADW